jgi:hypothetical protein
VTERTTSPHIVAHEDEAERVTDPYLPDGIVKLPPEPASPRSGCGVRGCLYGTVALFALLLVILVVAMLLRPWPTPVIPPGAGGP